MSDQHKTTPALAVVVVSPEDFAEMAAHMMEPPKQCFVACQTEQRCECREWAARIHAMLNQQEATDAR